MAFDFAGVLIDAMYYNNLKSEDNTIIHSGDSLDGESTSKFDEVIKLDLDTISPQINTLVFVINAFQGGSFNSVESAYAEVAQANGDGTSKVVADCAVGCGSDSTGCILAVIYRSPESPKQWKFRNTSVFCKGKNFIESMPSIRAIVDNFVDPGMILERTLSLTGKTFNMQKGDEVEIPADLFKSGDDIFIGLGWEAPGGLDLDASVIITDGAGGKINVVYFNNKSYGDSISHSGDNRTGEGAGDDERIDVDLDKIPDFVKDLNVVVTVYNSGENFSKVRDAYVRICAIKNAHELCRYKLDGGSVQTNGLLFAKIHRSPMGGWLVRAMGRECKGATALDPDIRGACNASGDSKFFNVSPYRDGKPPLEECCTIS